CDPSLTFTINNGEMSTSDGRYLSTVDGATWMAFQAFSPALAINTEFTVDSNGNLAWINSAFVGDQAIFCQDPSGQIDVLFQGPTDSVQGYPAYGTTC